MNYRTLEPGDVLAEGDQYVTGRGEWRPIFQSAGLELCRANAHYYRRPIQDLNSEGWRKCRGELLIERTLSDFGKKVIDAQQEEIERLRAALNECERLRREAVESEGRALARIEDAGKTITSLQRWWWTSEHFTQPESE